MGLFHLNFRAGGRGAVIGSAVGLVLGGPGGALVGAGLSGALNTLFSDPLDRLFGMRRGHRMTAGGTHYQMRGRAGGTALPTGSGQLPIGAGGLVEEG